MPVQLRDLFELIAENRASDLLLTTGVPPMIRVDGRLMKLPMPDMSPDEVKRLVYSLLSDEQKQEFEENKELDFSLAAGVDHRFRVNCFLQRGSVAAAFRPIPTEIRSLKELGLPPIAYDLCFAPQGLVLVTGPTGHGKSTTLASMLDVINTNRSCHIITIEDPIEYVHRHKQSVIEQRELGGDTHKFSTALKYVLRQDPDVILVGEMRDLDTISAALTVAETGHLVLATLHTNDAVQTIDRIVDAFPERQQQQVRVQLSLVLTAVLSQRLLPKAAGKGRVLATEVLRNNNASAAYIREGKTHQLYTVIETGTKDGMGTLDASLVRLYKRGVITPDEARRHMRNPQVLIDLAMREKQQEQTAQAGPSKNLFNQ